MLLVRNLFFSLVWDSCVLLVGLVLDLHPIIRAIRRVHTASGLV